MSSFESSAPPCARLQRPTATGDALVLERLVGASGSPSWITQRDGELLLANDALRAICDRSCERAGHGCVARLFESVDGRAVDSALAATASNGHESVEATVAVGPLKGARVRCHLLPIGSRENGCVYGTLLRVDERERSPEPTPARAIEWDDRSRAIIDAQTELVGRYTPDGRITFVNQAVCAFFGRTREELLSRNIAELLSPDELAQATTRRAAVTPERSSVTTTQTLRGQQGVRTFVWSTRGIFDTTGKLLELQGVGRDATDDLRREQELKTAHDQLDDALKETHHRIRNHLQVVRSSLALAIETPERERVASLLNQLRSRVDAIALVHEHLAATPPPMRVDADAYLRELVAGLVAAHATTDVTARVHPRPGAASEPILLDGDALLLLGRVAAELIGNALVHAFVDRVTGAIDVTLDRTSSGSLRLVVRDDGCGLGAQRRGDGLGLAIVRSLAAHAGGSLETRAAPNGGTLAIVTFAASMR